MRTRRFAHATLAVALILGSARQLEAQGTIRGVLFDSLRTAAPVPRAEIILVETGRRTASDAAGRFVFNDLPAGSHTVAYHDTWLDSLGLPALERTVSLSAGGAPVELVLSTPSPADYQRARCGTELTSKQGILFGEVWGSDGLPRERFPVAARWTEVVIGPGQIDHRLIATVDTTTESGMFILCGVPTDGEASLRAGAAADSAEGSGELLVAMEGATIRRRDLVVGEPGATVRMRGRILGADGRPLPNVAILLIGDTTHRATTDSSGRFVMTAQRRSTQILLRAIGHQPELISFDPLDDQLELPDVALRRAAKELATVTVTGAPMTVRRLEFEQRRLANPGGRFFDDEELAKLPVVTIGAIVAQVPRASQPPLKYSLGGEPPPFQLSFNSLPCDPLFFVDGHREGRNPSVSGGQQADFFQRAKRMEIYRGAFTPPQYSDFTGCGAVVIWTY